MNGAVQFSFATEWTRLQRRPILGAALSFGAVLGLQETSDSYPFITAKGRSLATLRARPARFTTSTTRSMSL
jgi:hypothetical protein